MKEARFDKLGAFVYSKEEGTPAAKMPNQIHPQTKKKRYHKIMRLQQVISEENLKQKIGKSYEIMIEGITKNERYYVGRSYMDIPEIDGVIYIQSFQHNCNKTRKLQTGEFVTCKIVDRKEYDLIGEVI